MNRLAYLFLLVSLLLNASLLAQASLQLNVQDESGHQLSGVEVYLEETNQILETDQDGKVELDDLDVQTYNLTFFAQGYTTHSEAFQLKKGLNQFDIRLAALSLDLSTVMVESEKETYSLVQLRNVEGTAIYAAKKSEVIDLEQVLGNKTTNNAREVYRGVAGLNIWENDGAGLQLAIGARGLDPNRTSNFNTRQNGYDISADALGYPESYYTPPTQALERIEIVRGAASLQYGTQFGGLLNFVLKQAPDEDGVEIESENSVGSFGLFSTFNSVGFRKGGLNVIGFYQYKQGDGWRPNSQFDQTTAYGRIGYDFSDRFNIGLEFTHMNYLAQQPGGLVDFEFQQDPLQSKRARNWFKVNWNLAALDLNYRFSDRTRLNVRNFLLMADRSALGELGPINRPDPERERDLLVGQYDNFGSEARLIHRYNLASNMATFLVGARYYEGLTRNQQGDANDGAGPDFAFLNPNDLEKSDYEFPSRNVSVFAENLFNIGSRLTITPGARFEYIRTASDGFFKRRVFSGGQVIFEEKIEDARINERSFVLLGLGLGYKVRPEIEAYFNFSQNYRSINFSDLAVVNPNLEVDSLLTDENGFNLDLGIRGFLSKRRIRIDLSAFYLRYNDRIGISEIIVPDPQVVERAVAYRTNIGDARILGIEAYAEANILRFINRFSNNLGLTAYLNLSLLHGEYLSGRSEFIGNDVELIPPVTVKTGLTAKVYDFRLNFLYTYVREHFSDATNALQVANATRGLIPSYQVMDLSASYEWKWFRLQTGINNLADTSYFTRRATGYPGPGIIPASPRSFYVALRVRFAN